MTWIKICGITNLDDALTAVEAGADALGLVFYEKSPRNIDTGAAADLVSQLPASIEKVGVFVNQAEDFICELASKVGLSAVQFHGDAEDPHVADLVVARHRAMKVLVAVPMLRPQPDGLAMMWSPDSVYAFLADTGGGTGKSFDWAASKGAMKTMGAMSRVVVAGGLTPANVVDCINILHPWGVDVSSGVEATPGKKDPEKVRAFISAVRNAEKVE